jgi:hypothetical protein
VSTKPSRTAGAHALEGLPPVARGLPVLGRRRGVPSGGGQVDGHVDDECGDQCGRQRACGRPPQGLGATLASCPRGVDDGEQDGQGHQRGHDPSERPQQPLFDRDGVRRREAAHDGVHQGVRAELGAGGEADDDRCRRSEDVHQSPSASAPRRLHWSTVVVGAPSSLIGFRGFTVFAAPLEQGDDGERRPQASSGRRRVHRRPTPLHRTRRQRVPGPARRVHRRWRPRPAPVVTTVPRVAARRPAPGARRRVPRRPGSDRPGHWHPGPLSARPGRSTWRPRGPTGIHPGNSPRVSRRAVSRGNT